MKKSKQLLLPEKDLDKALFYINGDFRVAFQIAPAVRVALGEEFGLAMGENVVEKIPSALKQAGADYVYDVCAGADFTIIEESMELAQRFREKKNLPLFTSCCPVWMKYLEYAYPDYVKYASTCKSPTEMLSTLIKYFSPDIKIVSVTPCVGKKLERERDNNIDVSLTTRELAELLKIKKVDLKKCPNAPFDELFGISSGAGLIFGVTGGVMEAVLRTTTHLLNNHKKSILEVKNNNCLKDEEFALNTIRSNESLRECEINTREGVLKIAIVNGIATAKTLLSEIATGKKYDFVEFQNCKGGCVNGPGQPYVDRKMVSDDDIVRLRGGGLYKLDNTNKVKSSHANANVLNIYNIIGEEKMHKMLHLNV